MSAVLRETGIKAGLERTCGNEAGKFFFSPKQSHAIQGPANLLYIGYSAKTCVFLRVIFIFSSF